MPIARSLFQSILWKGLVYVSTFILNILIARHFQAAQSGNIYYLINMFALVHLVAGFSLESGIIYFGARKQIAGNTLFKFALVWTLAVSLILFVLLNTASANALAQGDASTFRTYALLFVCGYLLYNYSAALFYAQKNFFVPNLISLLANLVLIALLPGHAFADVIGITNVNYFDIYFLAFLLQGVVTALAFYFSGRENKPHTKPVKANLKILFRYSAIAWVGNLFFFLLYRVDYWFVEAYCSPEALGNYIQVSKFGNLFFLLPTMVATAIFPFAATENESRMLGWLALISRTFLWGYALVCFVLAIIGRWLFPIVFGETFDLMYTAFLWLIPGILALSTLFTLTAYNAGKNRIGANTWGCVIALIVVVTGNVVLVPSYGINAAAASSSAGYIVYQVYLLRDFKKVNGTVILPFFIFKPGDIRSLIKLVTSTKNTNDTQL